MSWCIYNRHCSRWNLRMLLLYLPGWDACALMWLEVPLILTAFRQPSQLLCGSPGGLKDHPRKLLLLQRLVSFCSSSLMEARKCLVCIKALQWLHQPWDHMFLSEPWWISGQRRCERWPGPTDFASEVHPGPSTLSTWHIRMWSFLSAGPFPPFSAHCLRSNKIHYGASLQVRAQCARNFILVLPGATAPKCNSLLNRFPTEMWR